MDPYSNPEAVAYYASVQASALSALPPAQESDAIMKITGSLTDTGETDTDAPDGNGAAAQSSDSKFWIAVVIGLVLLGLFASEGK